MATVETLPDAETDAKQPSRSLSIGIVPITVLLLLAGSVVPWLLWFTNQGPGPAPIDQLQQALQALENEEYREALRLIGPLQNQNVSEPEFHGGVDYVIGMLAFHDAEIMSGSGKTRMYDMAVAYLREAERKSLLNKYKNQWEYALGRSLYALGDFRKAYPLLRNIFQGQTAKKAESALMLAECHLHPNTVEAERAWDFEQSLESAETYNSICVTGRELSAIDQLMAWDQHIRIALLNEDVDRAAQGLKTYRELIQTAPEAYRQYRSDPVFEYRDVILEAQIHMVKQDFDKAEEQLTELFQKFSGLENQLTRQAHYLLGVRFQNEMAQVSEQKTRERLINLALDQYQQAALDDTVDVAIAANLKIARLLQQNKQLHEEALEKYSLVLDLVDDPLNFLNQWIRIAEIREGIRDAWDYWIANERVDRSNFAWAIMLSDRMTEVFNEDLSAELNALANVSWAESLQAEYDSADVLRQRELEPELLERYRHAGEAYTQLAHVRRTSKSYPDALWNAAELYRKGHDYRHALQVLNQFKNSRPRRLLPLALVRQGEVLLGIDEHTTPEHVDKAIELLTSVLKNYSKDPAAYRAELLLGQAYWEKNETEQALEIWSRITTNGKLSPTAIEWMDALFALGRGHVLLGDQYLLLAAQAMRAEQVDEAQQHRRRANGHFQRAQQALHEFLKRDRTSDESFQARWLLANTAQKLSQFPLAQVERAETENERNRRIREANELLDSAIAYYKELQQRLKPLERENRLKPLEKQILLDAFYHPGYCSFILGEYDPTQQRYLDAIEYYRTAASHYSQTPQVLLAYYQMANCHSRLNRPLEARSQLEQARILARQLEENQNEQLTSFSIDGWKVLLNQAIEFNRFTQIPTATP